MNKKFSTLVAGLLLASSLPGVAQLAHFDRGEIDYRSQVVKSASLDQGFFKVNKIEDSKYYQLVVNSEGLEANDLTYVLTMERDYSTGHLYLAVKPIQDAVLTHSLWKIEYDPRTTNGRQFIFTNRETDYPITFDPYNAQLLTATGAASTDANLTTIKYFEGDGNDRTILNGCQDDWAWYETPDNSKYPQPNEFQNRFVYSYFHASADSIMALSLVKKAATEYLPEGYYVQAVKDRKDHFGTIDASNVNIPNLISLRPVIAGAKVLNAEEINTMIDSDGSYMDFFDYSPWWNNSRKGKSVKFTVFNPGSATPMTSLNVNPFTSKYVAEESDFESLARNRFDYQVKTIANVGTDVPNVYAGYNVLFRKNNTTDQYLKVSHELYEDVKVGNYNAQKVQDEKLVKGSVMTAELARYHWKVTYYASNDSVVMEPLNASRDTNEGVKTPTSDQPEDFYNTINAGVAFTSAQGATENNSYNKFAEVPVALFVMNFGAGGDAQKYLTIGEPDGNNNAEELYHAMPKFDFHDLTYTEGSFKVAGDNPAYVTNSASYHALYRAAGKVAATDVNSNIDCTHNANSDYLSIMYLRLGFAPTYKPLVRTSFTDGLYFINLKTGLPLVGNGSRKDGAYLVYNHIGRMMYASENEHQDFGYMPSAQWVIKQKPCLDATSPAQVNATPVVEIYNREYGNQSGPVFEGQLYTTPEGAIYIINHRDYYNPARQDGTFRKNVLTCSDTLLISPVDRVKYAEAYTSEYHGYKHFDIDNLVESANQPYYFRYNDRHIDEVSTSTDKYLYVTGDNYLAMSDPGEADYALQRNLFEIEPVLADQPFGYNKIQGIKNLKRTVYALKVRDNNNIDNNRKYVAVVEQNGKQRYAIVKLADINGRDKKIAEFYLKVDEYTPNATKDTCYVLVDVRSYDNVLGKDAANAQDLDNTILNGRNDLDEEIKELNPNPYEERLFSQNGWQILYVSDDPDNCYPYEMDDNRNINYPAFQLVKTIRPLYKPVGEEREVNGTINLFVNDGINGGAQYLYEMANNQNADVVAFRNGFNYAGMTSEGIKPVGKKTTTSLYVDSVMTSPVAPVAMPQYMIWVDNDNIKDGYYCEDYLEAPGHGYFPAKDLADKDDMEHYVYYNGYVSGRMLVNLNDSVAKYVALNKLDEASRFKYNNRTRLGFVEGIHMYFTKAELAQAGAEKYFATGAVPTNDVEVVYVLKNTTLEAIRDNNNYINPKKLKAGIDAGAIEVKAYLNGTHRNYVWALRYTEDEITDPSEGQGTGRQHTDFLLESSDVKDGVQGQASIGGYRGAWVDIDGNVPVLVKYSTANGDHDDLVGTPISEGLNQAQIFNLKATSEVATSVDPVEVSNIRISVEEGKVIINGAAGKVVSIYNVLGQPVSQSIATSDNAVITVPAGLVVVSVEGEKSVKAVVK